MSLPALLIRFTLAYVAMLLAVTVVLAVFGIKGNSGINTAALLGAVMWSCHMFAKKNSRYFSKEEKSRVVLGMVAIDLLLQAILSAAVASAGAGKLAIGPMLAVLAFVGLLHALVIYFFVGVAGKQYAKQVAKGG